MNYEKWTIYKFVTQIKNHLIILIFLANLYENLIISLNWLKETKKQNKSKYYKKRLKGFNQLIFWIHNFIALLTSTKICCISL